MAAKRRVARNVPIVREDQGKCMSWCINNGIKIYVKLGEEYLDDEEISYWNSAKNRKDKKTIQVTKIKNPYENGLSVKVEVNDNGLIKTSGDIYTHHEAHIKIWELYCYMYDKYSQQT